MSKSSLRVGAYSGGGFIWEWGLNRSFSFNIGQWSLRRCMTLHNNFRYVYEIFDVILQCLALHLNNCKAQGLPRGRGFLRGKVIGTCHFEKYIRAITACHYLKNWSHNYVSLTKAKRCSL